MKWDIEYTDEFGGWWATLIEPEQESVKASVELLGEFGPNLRYPYSSGITTSKHDHLRELRIQHAGHPYRVLYAFDPRRCAIFTPPRNAWPAPVTRCAISAKPAAPFPARCIAAPTRKGGSGG